MPLTFADSPLYYRDSQGQYHRFLSGADMTGYMPKGTVVDITNDCQIGTGTISYVRYYQIGDAIVLIAQIFNINFTGVNVWLKLPDSFPGNADLFTALATGFDGMECVFRTQSGNGKYLLIQSTQQGSYNLTATGICFT